MNLKPLVVVDTHILVSALRSSLGFSFALIQAIRRGAIRMCCSPALFLKYEDVLKRPSQLDIFELTIFGLYVLTPQQAFARFRLRKPDRKGPSTS